MNEISIVKNTLRDRPDGRNTADIPTGRIIPGKGGAYTGIADGTLTALAESISRYGVKEPLTVTPSEKSGVYILIDGKRRLRAAKMLGLSSVPCIVADEPAPKKQSAPPVPGGDLFSQAQAFENLARVYGLTQEELAEKFSVSRSYIANKLRLLRFTEEEKRIIKIHGLSERHARALIRIDDPEKRKAALEYTAEHKLSVCQTEEYTDRLLSGNEKKKEPGKKPGELKSFYDQIDGAVRLLINSGYKVKEERTLDENFITVKITVGSGCDNVII